MYKLRSYAELQPPTSCWCCVRFAAILASYNLLVVIISTGTFRTITTVALKLDIADIYKLLWLLSVRRLEFKSTPTCMQFTRMLGNEFLTIGLYIRARNATFLLYLNVAAFFLNQNVFLYHLAPCE